MTERPRTRTRAAAGRRRRRLRLVVLVGVLVIAIVAVGVWLAVSRAMVPGASAQLYPLHHESDIARVAKKNGLDPYLVAAVARTESNWDAEVVSHAGAVGLMQIMPDTAKWITGKKGWSGGDDPDLTDPKTSLELGAFYLAYLVKYFGGDTRLALAAYNAGPGAVSRWLQAKDTKSSMEVADIPIAETRGFVERVEHYWELYARIHPDAFAGESGSTWGRSPEALTA